MFRDKSFETYCWTAPLLRQIFIQEINYTVPSTYHPKIIPQFIDTNKKIDLIGMIKYAIKYVNRKILKSDECKKNDNCPLERVLQGELYAVLRYLLNGQTHRGDYSILMESRSGKNNSLDFRFSNGHIEIIELKVGAMGKKKIEEAIDQAKKYAKENDIGYSYFLNFVPRKLNDYCFDYKSNVIVIHIIYDEKWKNFEVLTIDKTEKISS